MSRRAIAAFDFDGTLTQRDTLVPFLTRLAGPATVARALAAEAPGLARVAAGRGDRDAVKERILTRVLAGRAVEEVDAAGTAFGAELARSAITADGRERIAWHRGEGHELVIVSATLDVYLGEVARALDVKHLLCTGLVADANGRCTGQLRGANCRGPEKARRLRSLFGNDEIELWAYGNSHGDDEMLGLAQHPVRFSRGRARAAAAGSA